MNRTKYALLDVSMNSENAGDTIITEAITAQVLSALPGDLVHVPTHRRPTLKELRALARADVVIAGGSNLLSSHMERHRQWLVTPDLVWALTGKIVLCGVGWWQYQGEPCAYSRWLLRRILSPSAIHSVRDGYTAHRLERLGAKVVNTNCPTMWGLPVVPRAESPSGVVTTVTNYHRDLTRDTEMLRELQILYKDVKIVPMASDDLDYLSELEIPAAAEVCSLGVESLNTQLQRPMDYVGTRLHAGIRALQKGRRSVIVAIDNRAKEMSRDTGLPVLDPFDLSASKIEETVRSSFPYSPILSSDAVALWQSQFWEKQ